MEVFVYSYSKHLSKGWNSWTIEEEDNTHTLYQPLSQGSTENRHVCFLNLNRPLISAASSLASRDLKLYPINKRKET